MRTGVFTGCSRVKKSHTNKNKLENAIVASRPSFYVLPNAGLAFL
jgi:hypothetical protein